MSLRDILIGHLFKQDDNGRTVVFPNGALGRGYVLPDAASEARVRRCLGWIMMGAIAFGVGGSQAMHLVLGEPGQWPYAAWGAVAGSLIALALGYQLAVAQLVRNLASSPARLSLFEAVEKQALGMPRWYLWTMACTGFVLGLGAAVVAFKAASTAERLMGICGAALFAMVLLQALYGLGRASR